MDTMDDEESRPITGEFEDAVERLNEATGQLYNADFENIAEHHGAIVEAMAALAPHLQGLPEAIEAWYIEEEGDYPVLDEPYGDALSDVIDNFNGMRNNTSRVIGYAHSYNEFSNALGQLVSFCRRWDWERGFFREA